MNTCIMNELKRFKNILSSDELISSETIDSIICELEMMKMEIEQHITNMPKDIEHANIRSSAQNAIQKLSEILDLLEELPNDKTLVSEILELVDDIYY